MLPELSTEAIARRVQQQLGKERKSRFFAYFGRAPSQDRAKLEGGRELVIRSARSELELRAMLAEFDETDAPVAFAVPFDDALPFDLQGYFALGGRVEKIGIVDQVKARLTLDELQIAYDHPLLEPLLTLPGLGKSPTRRLDEEGLYRLLLQQRYQYPVGDFFELPRMLAFAATNGRGAELERDLPAPAIARLEQLLEERHGPAMALAFRAWRGGQGLGLLALGLATQDLVASSEDNVDYWYANELGKLLGEEVPEALRPRGFAAPRRALAEAVRTALLLYERESGDDAALATARRGALEARAEKLLSGGPHDVAAWLERHPALPAGWTARVEAFGRQLTEALSGEPSRASFQALRESFDALQKHQRPDERLERARTALRLYAYLVQKPEPDAESLLGEVDVAERIGRWYAREGGLVDLAREQLRYNETGRFGEGLALLTQRVDARRDELDEQFARGLRAWAEGGRRATSVLPIHAAIDRLAIPFLEAVGEKRLLVLLLDGMSWAAAHSLLDSLAARARKAWAPLGFHHSAEGKIGEPDLPAVFAELPTVTEISRAAFFAGKRMKPGLDHATKDDPKRFAAHPGLRKFLGSAEPKLFLRGDGHEPGGLAAEEVLRAVEGEREVVGCVINAIDASLKGDSQHVTRWTLETIRSLDALLEAAEKSRRTVLLCADHGHVPGGRLKYRTGGGGAARYRPLEEGEAPAERELALMGDAAWRPRGAAGVALLVGERDRYSKGNHAGEHGGVALAEVVTPCVLIGPWREDESVPKLARATRLEKPAWWRLSLEDTKGAQPAAAKKRKKPEPSPQLPLGGVLERPPSRPSVGALLAASPLLAARVPDEKKRRDVARAVDALVAHNNNMSADDFATATKSVSYRVAGLVAALGEALNVDGYPVITFDSAKKLVRLELAQLLELFEVSE